MPSSTEPIAWVSEDGLHNIKAARERGASHYSVQVRIDRLDDYDTVPLYAGRAGATPDLTEDEHPHGGPSRLALMRRNGELRVEVERLRAGVERLRAGAIPDLTALPTAEQVQEWQADNAEVLVTGDLHIRSVLAAVAALVRSAQNDTDHG
jgi:hypothetical protein